MSSTARHIPGLCHRAAPFLRLVQLVIRIWHVRVVPTLLLTPTPPATTERPLHLMCEVDRDTELTSHLPDKPRVLLEVAPDEHGVGHLAIENVLSDRPGADPADGGHQQRGTRTLDNNWGSGLEGGEDVLADVLGERRLGSDGRCEAQLLLGRVRSGGDVEQVDTVRGE